MVVEALVMAVELIHGDGGDGDDDGGGPWWW